MKPRFILYLFFLLFLMPVFAHAQGGTTTAAVDTDLIQSKIMLIDATLDLNQALLQGIKASLDSLNVKDKGVVDEKNMQATIRSMQRRRDKALLTPFLLHMQDSLNTEIGKEQTDKTNLESVLNGLNPKKIGTDTVKPAVSKTDTLLTANIKDTVAAIKMTAIDTAVIPVTQTVIKREVPVDTSIALVNPVPVKKEEISQVRPVADTSTVIPTHLSIDTAHVPLAADARPMPVRASTPIPQVRHWETARAIYDNDEAPVEARPENEVAVDTQTLQNSRDTGAYIPARAGGGQYMSDSVRLLKAQLFLTRARKAANEKNYKTAIEDLQKSIDLLPAYYDAWFDLAEADMHLGFYTKALNELRACLRLDSTKAVLFYRMGSLDLKLKQNEEARSYFNKSLELDSNYVPAIMAKALILNGEKDYSRAIKEYARALKSDPGYHSAYKAKAMAEYHLKRYEHAIDDFTRFLIFDESDAHSFYVRGLCKIALHQGKDGCADLSYAARLGSHAASKSLEIHCK